MKSIFEYENHCTFLGDYIAENRNKSNVFSYRYIGNKLGVDPSNLAKVVQGKRNLSKNMIQPFCRLLKLNKRECKYFEALVNLDKTTNNIKKQKIFDELMAIRSVSTKKIEATQYDLYQKWYHTAILALLYFFDFKDNFKELANALDPKIKEKDAKESIALLEELGLIKKSKKGIFIHTHNLISTGEKWSSIAIHTFQCDMLQLALRSLRTHKQKIRDISTITVTVSEDDIKKIKLETAEYRKKVLRIVNDSDFSDQVYQLNIQFFPLLGSRRDEKNSNS